VPRLISVRALWTIARAGRLRARVRANRTGVAAIHLHLAGAALDSGLLDALASGPGTLGDLARRMAVRDEALLAAFVRVVASAGLVDGPDGGPWRLTRRGRDMVEDDVVRAVHQAFSGFHTGLYRDLPRQLAGDPPRRDVAEHGALIARVSAGLEPLVLEQLTRVLGDVRPRRVLDIGCGAGLQLAAMLEAAPGADGVGIDADAGAAALAERTLRDRGVAGRGHVVRGGLREAARNRPGALAEPFDLAVLANVVYYVPPEERVALFRDAATLIAPGGTLFVVTTVAMAQFFSRHFDLLLQSQEGEMELSDARTITEQLRQAGLVPGKVQPLVAGLPIVTVTATLPGGAKAPEPNPRSGRPHQTRDDLGRQRHER
jgi:SAM-dependent methyltransferase